jgi:hypothetical protein
VKQKGALSYRRKQSLLLLSHDRQKAYVLRARQLDFTLDVLANEPVKYPVEIQIANPDNLEISELSPQPSFRNASIIQFITLPSSEVGYSSVGMHIQDRERAARTELIIVAAGSGSASWALLRRAFFMTWCGIRRGDHLLGVGNPPVIPPLG